MSSLKFGYHMGSRSLVLWSQLPYLDGRGIKPGLNVAMGCQ